MNIKLTSTSQINALERLHEWSVKPANKELMGAHAFSVSRKIRNSIFTASQINASAECKPTIGIYGPSQAGKSYLTAKFAENAEGALIVNLGAQYHFLQEVNPAGGRESTALVSRFTTDVTESGDSNFPIKAQTLSEADIICVLANSYFCDTSYAEYPDSSEIDNKLSGLETETDQFRGSLSQSDFRLEHYLSKKIFPRDISERFTALWNKADAISKLPSTAQRAEIYSLLWNGNESYTKLYIKLSEALEKIGGESQIFLQSSSLIPRETSIIDVTILENLDQETHETEVVFAGAKKVELNKSVLSALISELFLPTVAPRRAVFENADILDFPGARTRFQKTISSDGNNGIHEFFLRGKIDYLFHKFTMDMRLDALVFCIDPGPLNVRELPDSLNDWLQLNSVGEGSSEDNLFFTLTKFDTHFPDAAGNQADEIQRFENAIDSGLIQPFANESTSWPINWNGGKFKNVFPLRNPNYPLHGYFEYEGGVEVSASERMITRLNELKEGFLNSPLVRDHIFQAENKWLDLVAVNGGGAEFLSESIEKLDLNSLKEQNLQFQLKTIAGSVCDVLSMFVHTEDGSERLSLEKQKFSELLDPILAIGQSGKFPAFLKSVGASENLLKASISSFPDDDKIETVTETSNILTGWRPSILDEEGSEPSVPLIDQKSDDPIREVTDKMVGSWLNSLENTTSATKIAANLNTSVSAFEFLLSHLAHEKQIDILRNKIVQRLKGWTYGLTRDSNVDATAKIASDEINAHVYLRGELSKIDTVSGDSFSQFEITELDNPILKWQRWLNDFGKLLKSNCELKLNASYDVEQNRILVENIEELKSV